MLKSFPSVKGLLKQSHTIPVKYDLHIRKSPKADISTTYNVCFINKNEEGYIFQAHGEDLIEHYGPLMGTIDYVLISPDVESVSIQHLQMEYKYVATDTSTNSHRRLLKDAHVCFERVEVQEPDMAKIEEDVRQYDDMKSSLLLTNIIMTAVGSSLISTSQNPPDVIAFAFGGITGIVYQLLLQLDIDHIGKKDTNILIRLLANNAVRLSCVGSMMSLFLMSNPDMNLPLMLGGFWMHKIAMILTFLKAM